jgi:glycosyltransferase involved in cell wall biosynthesis
MACGKPVVTSDVGGMPDTVGNMIGGLVFRVKDSEDLSKKLLALIGNRELRDLLGKQARERSLNYSIGKVIDCIVDFYQSLQSK